MVALAAVPAVPAAPPSRRDLVVPRGAVVLVAGLPGAGKTTFLRRVVRDPAVRVLDSDDVRRALERRLGPAGGGPLLRPLVHLGHALRVAGRGPSEAALRVRGPPAARDRA